MSGATPAFEARVMATRYEAETIISYELHPFPGRSFEAFTAGAHIDLHLGNGQVKNYSLLNSQSERDRYVIAVNKDPASKGGSRFIHENIHVGDIVKCSGPRNNFPLNETAAHSVLIAGGIGITPLLSMIYRLEDLGRSWELHYAARTRNNAAFVDRLVSIRPNDSSNLHINFDHEANGKMLDLRAIVERCPQDSHLYCCGPVAMLQSFEEAAKKWPESQVHVEYFAPKEAPATGGGFEVVLERSGITLTISPGKTILDAVLEAGVDVPSSCLQGACGSCETKVVSGIPDHRDVLLTKEERAANKTMMICCSGSKSPRLVLDL